MKKLQVYLSLALLLFSMGTAVHAQNKTYTNPIIDEDAPDPTVMRANDGMFYLYATGAKVFRSPDMVNWTSLGRCFTPDSRPTFVPGVRYIWAPDINYIGDKYVLYYALSKWGGVDSCGIGAAYADRPEGPFTCVNGNGKLFRSYEVGVRNSIDPFYIEDKGHKWLLFGSFNGIYALELNKDGLSIKDINKKIQVAGTAYEGTYIYKRKGYYYFFGSIGTCCEREKSTYTTVVARSKHVLGPYVDKFGRPLLDNFHEILIRGNADWAGTGHNAEIIEDKQGDTWISYHAYHKPDARLGRVVLLDKVLWDKDGWPYVVKSEPARTAPAPVF